MLTSQIESPTRRTASLAFSFPGLFRSTNTGSIWLAYDRNYGVRVSVGPDNYRPDRAVGDAPHKFGLQPAPFFESSDFDQVTTPVTITFNP